MPQASLQTGGAPCAPTRCLNHRQLLWLDHGRACWAACRQVAPPLPSDRWTMAGRVWRQRSRPERVRAGLRVKYYCPRVSYSGRSPSCRYCRKQASCPAGQAGGATHPTVRQPLAGSRWPAPLGSRAWRGGPATSRLAGWAPLWVARRRQRDRRLLCPGLGAGTHGHAHDGAKRRGAVLV